MQWRPHSGKFVNKANRKLPQLVICLIHDFFITRQPLHCFKKWLWIKLGRISYTDYIGLNLLPSLTIPKKDLSSAQSRFGGIWRSFGGVAQWIVCVIVYLRVASPLAKPASTQSQWRVGLEIASRWWRTRDNARMASRWFGASFSLSSRNHIGAG